MDWFPHVTVATVIENNGKYLLIEEQSNGDLVINQPAGHLDPNETLQEAAIRETFEETGWHIRLLGIVGVGLYTSQVNQVTYHRTTFYAEAIKQDSEAVLDDGIEGTIWMTYEEMQAASDRMRSELVIQSVEQYRQGHKYSLDMIFS